MIQRRKKNCPMCRQNLWLHDFYKCASGYSSHCKECIRKEKRLKYALKRKVPDGRFLHKTKDRLVEHNGYSTSILWSGNMLSLLQRYFSTTRNEELAELVGVSSRTLVRKARELGLAKDPVWLKKIYNLTRLTAQAESKRKGHPGAFKKGNKIGEKYRFQKSISSV